MNKTEALNRLASLENETKELHKIIEAPEPSKNIKERVKSFKDACKITGDSENLPFPTPYNKIQERINYDYMIYVITKALNENWKLDWKDSNQYKWYPWMLYKPALSAFRFDGSFLDTTLALAGSGVRLASKELSDYFGTQFEELISSHLLTLQ